MKKLLSISAFLTATGVLAAGGATATPIFGDDGAAVQTVLNDITIDGNSSIVASTDFLSDSFDQIWSLTATGGSITTIVFTEANFASTDSFGIFDAADPANSVQLFGEDAAAGAQATVSINDVGEVYINHAPTGVTFADDLFGYYLGTEQDTFYSVSDFNVDGLDHMAAYQGTGDTVKLTGWPQGTWTSNEYILFWENTAGGGVGNFTDFVAMVGSVAPASGTEPVPEPSTMLLLGAGFAGLAAWRRRNNR